MNEVRRLLLGVFGLLAGIELKDVATFAACLASFATFLYMGLCALEKWRALRAARPPTPRA